MENEVLNWIRELCKERFKISEISFKELSTIDIFYIYVEVYAKFGIILPLENGDFLNSNISLAKNIASKCYNPNSKIRLKD